MNAEEALAHPWLHMQDHSTHIIDHSIIDNLEKFSIFSPFKKAALFAVAFSLGQSEIHQIREAFEEIDTEDNGFLTFNEFHDVLAENGVKEDKIKKMYETLDHTHHGQIDYTEFIAAALEKRVYLEEERLHDAFHEFDQNHTGFITVEDLQNVLGGEYEPEEV